MTDSPFDTIVAPITGIQRAAVAIVRVSGPEAWEVAARVFAPWPDELQARHIVYGRVTNGDEALLFPFEAGHSYTGEESVELSIHGSPASVRSLVQACVEAGARRAAPGEFTQRAFLNGRMDLTQAEAVRDTVEAQTDSQLRAANLLRSGALYEEVSGIVASLLEVLTAVEASTDFSEEIGELDRPWADGVLASLLDQIDRLLETAASGRIMRSGLRIAIVGPPNSGKSSLLNRLLGSDRAIVTDIPGTTRDFVEEAADLSGVPCVLIDTAGLRESADPVEAIGVQRSRAQAANADLIWYVFDASVGWTEADDEATGAFGRPVVAIANKADLLEGRAEPGICPLSGGGQIGGRSVSEANAEGGSGTAASEPPPSPIADRQSRLGPPLHAMRTEGAGGEGPESPPSPIADRQSLPISALTGKGLSELIETVQPYADVAPDRPLINDRHEDLLVAAKEAIQKAREVLRQDLPSDLVSTCLQEAARNLGQITGETASDEMLEAIFSRFCVGK